MDIIGMLKGAFDAIAGVFGYARDRQNLNNAPEMKQGAKNVQSQKAEDKITKDVAAKDVEAVRKDIALVLALSFVLLGGCVNTVIPKQATPTVATIDGGEQNSGLIRFDDLGRGVITTGARERYNALVRLYGNQFLVPLVEDAGVQSGAFEDKYGPTYLIDAEHLRCFAIMANWYRNGAAAVRTIPTQIVK